MPVVEGLSTMPMVLPSGEMITANGLHRGLRVVFDIDPALLAMLPKREACTPDAVAAALSFLTAEWLGDVLTTFAGKCTLVAATRS